MADKEGIAVLGRPATGALGVIILLVLVLVSQYSYLLFHSLAEFFSIVIGFSVFILAWHARNLMRSSHLMLIGISFLFISFLDLIHTLAYHGMGVFPSYDANLPTQLWIAARYLQSASLLGASLLACRRIQAGRTFVGYTAATTLILISIFAWDIFPVSYVAGIGLTPFKVLSEYVISMTFAASALILIRHRRRFDPGVLRLLIASIVLMIAGELAFTLYVGVYDFPNLVGHLFKIVSFFLIYRAILVTGILRPFDLLFRDLKLSELALQEANETLEHKVRGRTAELGRTVEQLEQEVEERTRAESSLKRTLKRLKTLREIDLAIGSSLDPRVTLSVVVGKVIDELEVDAANILVYNRLSQNFEYAAGLGFKTTALRHSRVRKGEGFAGQVALTKRSLCIEDLDDTHGEFWKSPEFFEEGFQSYCATPLLAKGHVQGILEVFNRRRTTRAEEWLEFLEALAGQAVIALENATLFEQLTQSNEELLLAYDSTIAGWSMALELRDIETQGHTRRVTEMTLRVAREMGVPVDQEIHVRRGAMLHDIGKMAIPDSILLKPDALTEQEWVIMRRHPEHALHMLSKIAYLGPALEIPYSHHEKWDGNGYPLGLQNEEIPFAARLFAVIDVYDALTSDRRYRKAWLRQDALSYVQEQSGIHFDPAVVKVFLEKADEITATGKEPAVRHPA